MRTGWLAVQAAVLAIVVEAVFKVGKRALKNRVMIGLAGLSFIMIFFFHAAFPLIILAAALIGFVGHAAGLKAFSGSFGHGEAKGEREEPAAIDRAFAEAIPDHVRPSWTRAIKITAICLALWLGPVVALVYTLGWDNVFSNIGLFFWRVRDNLSFDVGLRHALTNGHPVNEIRAGLTFGFPLDVWRTIATIEMISTGRRRHYLRPRPYRSRNLPLLSATRDTSLPSFVAFTDIPSAVDLMSRTCV